MQFDTTVNKWHTCRSSGPINASNPCSEYMFLDDSACNLASFNLMKFMNEKELRLDYIQKNAQAYFAARAKTFNKVASNL
jgi:ribonucleoside-diphosphate reductase alpha chain